MAASDAAQGRVKRRSSACAADVRPSISSTAAAAREGGGSAAAGGADGENDAAGVRIIVAISDVELGRRGTVIMSDGPARWSDEGCDSRRCGRNAQPNQMFGSQHDSLPGSRPGSGLSRMAAASHPKVAKSAGLTRCRP